MNLNRLKLSMLVICILSTIACSSNLIGSQKESQDRMPATFGFTKIIKYGNTNLTLVADYYSPAGDGIILRDIQIIHQGQKHFLVGTFGYKKVHENTTAICNSLGYKFARQVHYLAEDFQDKPPGIILENGKVSQVSFSPKLAYVNTIHCGNDLIEMDRGN